MVWQLTDWSLFSPTLTLDKLEDLQPLVVAGFCRVILIDIDDTIVPLNTEDVSQPKIKWFDDLHALGINIAVTTNNRDGKHIYRVADRIKADFFVIGCLPPWYKLWNPRMLRNDLFVEPIRRTLEYFQIDPQKMIVCNDSHFVIHTANQLGCRASVLVKPINPRRNSSTFIRLGRLAEKHIIEPRLQPFDPPL